MAKSAVERFEALDSLRGIFACMVVFHHMASTSWLTNRGIFLNGWLGVDYFFVLSGFVIAASYMAKLKEGYPVGKFMALRAGRLLPLHYVVLGLWLSFEIVSALSPYGGLSLRQPFTGSRSPGQFFASLLFIQPFTSAG